MKRMTSVPPRCPVSRREWKTPLLPRITRRLRRGARRSSMRWTAPPSVDVQFSTGHRCWFDLRHREPGNGRRVPAARQRRRPHHQSAVGRDFQRALRRGVRGSPVVDRRHDPGRRRRGTGALPRCRQHDRGDRGRRAGGESLCRLLRRRSGAREYRRGGVSGSTTWPK